MSGPDNGDKNYGGFVRWQELTAMEERIRDIRDRELDTIRNDLHELDGSTKERFQSAHVFHTSLNSDMLSRIDRLEIRVDGIESVIDQVRGARNLVYALMGTNVLLAAVGLLTLLHFTGVIP